MNKLPIWSHFKLTALLSTLVAAVGFMAMDVYFPSLPAIATSLHVSHGFAQLTVAAFLTSFSLSQAIYGPLSDYLGRRPLLLLGFIIYVLGCWVCYKTTTFPWLLMGRLIQGAGAGAGANLSRVVLRDISSGNKMAQIASILTVLIASVTALSPAVGGLVQKYYGYAGNFLLMLVSGLLAVILLVLFLPETNLSPKSKPIHVLLMIREAASICKNKIFLAYVLSSGLAFSLIISYASINPFIIQSQYGLSPAHYGFLALLIASSEIVGTVINARLVLRVGLDKMMLYGITIILIAGIGLLVSVHGALSIVQVCVFCALGTIGTAFIFPNASAGAFSLFDNHIGIVGALYGLLQMLITALTSYSISFGHLHSQVNLGEIFIIISGLSLVLSYLKTTARN